MQLFTTGITSFTPPPLSPPPPPLSRDTGEKGIILHKYSQQGEHAGKKGHGLQGT